MINWRVRFKNPAFYATFIPAVMLAIQAVAYVFGIKLDLSDIGNRIMTAVDAVLAVLAILGIVVDPTTKGVKDSERAQNYNEPN